MGGILSVLCLCHFLCTVTDFSAGALPIGVKFCTTVRPHLRQVFSYFAGDSPRDGWIMGVNRGPYCGICLLLKHLLFFLEPKSSSEVAYLLIRWESPCRYDTWPGRQNMSCSRNCSPYNCHREPNNTYTGQFYRATADCNATHGIAVAILFVCPSVCQMRVLWQNEIIVCQYLNTIQNRDISSLSTPTVAAGNCPLPLEIFAESDPSGLNCSAYNCTVNFSDVDIAHFSRTASLRWLSSCLKLK